MAFLPGVNLLPSTGEFAYDTIAHEGQRPIETSPSVINCYFAPGAVKTDYSYAIDQLQAAHPECTTVSLVVAWFANSLDASVCKIYPSTTYPYYAGQELLANKQLVWWWNNPHQAIYDTGGGWVPQRPNTQWVPQSKSISFTEYGFASVDRATNQPNVFFSGHQAKA
ncbi:MAG TPA: glycoside hydrolase TIM-barrel-like domain-containing protein [Methylocella sp.]|nr:glycoside hydrolase TIM-barrel-like domain-containing protein [Methylocella sp.]